MTSNDGYIKDLVGHLWRHNFKERGIAFVLHFFFEMFRCCAFVLCCCALYGRINASAIPVWEFLSKQEKMSFIYSIFANMVEDFCEASALQDCNKELMKYGLDAMKKLHEDILDHMDPYQKNSHHIIWTGMLQGHPQSRSPPKEKPPTTTPTPNSYNDDKTIRDFGSQGAASTDLDTVYRLPPPQGYTSYLESEYPPNVEALIKATTPVEEELTFVEYSNGSATLERVPLTGPVVIKVHPDGTPVNEMAPVHHDEDLKQHLRSQTPLPESI